MSSGIVRVKRSPGDFFQAYKPPFQNEKLSFAARGMLAYLCTKPDDWEVRNEDLIKASPGGKAALQTILKELRNAGHLQRIAKKDSKGIFIGWDTLVYENPADNPEFTDIPGNGKSDNRKDRKMEIRKTGKRKKLIITSTNNNIITTTPAGQVSQHFSETTGKLPRGIIDQQEWDADSQDILDKAGGDVSRACGLVDQAITTLDELGYTYKSPSSLLDTIDKMLQPKQRRNGSKPRNQKQPTKRSKYADVI